MSLTACGGGSGSTTLHAGSFSSASASAAVSQAGHGSDSGCQAAISANLDEAWNGNLAAASSPQSQAELAIACKGFNQLQVDAINLQVVCSKPAAERDQLEQAMNPALVAKMPGICSDSIAQLVQIINQVPTGQDG
jgi:hypothetical protein